MSDNKQSNRPNAMTSIGTLLMALGVVLSINNRTYTGTNDVLAFLSAAAPWLLLGLGVALTCAGAMKDAK